MKRLGPQARAALALSCRNQIALARAKAEAGEFDEALRLLWDLGVTNRFFPLPMDVSMRWWELIGVVERAIGVEVLKDRFARWEATS